MIRNDPKKRGRKEATILSYPYLIWSLVLLASYLIGFSLFHKERGRILISALLSVPAAGQALVFVPQYWKPLRILKSPIGIEDIIFSFATGGIAWIVICAMSGGKTISRSSPGRITGRYLLLLLSGSVLSYVSMQVLDLPIMDQALIGISIIGLVLLAGSRFKTWRIAAAGSMIFTLYYSVFTGIVMKLFPHMRSYWNDDMLWGISIMNIPIEEIMWALAFGAVWPLAMAFVFDLKAGTKRQSFSG